MTTTTTASRQKRGAVGPSGANANGHFKTLKFKGLKLNVPGKVKLRMLKQLTEGTQEEMIAAVEALLGEEQMEQVWDLDVDISKGLDALGVMLGALAEEVFSAYDTTAGKSPASPQP